MYGNAASSEENKDLNKTHFIISGKEIRINQKAIDIHIIFDKHGGSPVDHSRPD